MIFLNSTLSLHHVNEEFETSRIHFIPQGWLHDPLAFMLLMDRWSLTQNALLHPYDTTTWLLILLCIPMISIFLVLFLREPCEAPSSPRTSRKLIPLYFKIKCDSSTYIGLMLMVLGSIIEQNPQEKLCRNEKSRGHPFRILFGIWLLISLVISNGYTGIVISFLCSTLLPSSLPSTIKDLNLPGNVQNFPTVSADHIYYSPMKRVFHYAELLIFEYLITAKDQPNYQPHYGEMRKRTFFLANYTKDQLLYIYSTRDSSGQQSKLIPLDRVKKGMNESVPGHQNGWRIPLNFAFISRQSSVIRFAKLAKKISRNMITWMPVENTEILSVRGKLLTLRLVRLFHLYLIVIPYF